MKNNIKNIKILTPDGYKSFSGIQKLFKSCLRIEYGEKYLECSKNHRICVDLKNNIFKVAEELNIGDSIESIDGLANITNILDIGERDVYDLLNVENNQYYTNDIISHNCEFDQIGDSQLDGILYEEFKKNTRQPLYVLDDGHYNIWENPNPERIYVVGVDIAEGVGKDYSVIQILDITDPRFIQQVAVYANNKITPLEFTPKLREILQNWGDPLALIERNNCGAQVVDNLKKDFNYENIVSWGNKHTALKDVYRPMHLGMVSHTNTKYKAIMNQQYWINTTKRVHINDLHTVNELKDFVRMKNATFSAKSGSNDDRVMSLVWALMILHPEITERYFQILDKDEHHMPTILKPMDYGVNYFLNPTSIYTNDKESIGGDALPTFLGSPTFSENMDIEDLHNAGYKPLY